MAREIVFALDILVVKLAFVGTCSHHVSFESTVLFIRDSSYENGVIDDLVSVYRVKDDIM